jgi:hypothetical protein
MIENVIENLDKLYNDIKQEQEITQSSIQNNAKEILSEIMKLTDHYYDLDGIEIKTNNWSNRKGIHIETTDNGYFGTIASFTQIRDKQEWANVDCNVRLSDNINEDRIIKNIAFGQLVLAIAIKMRTDQELMNGLFNKIHKCFYSNEVLEAKMTLIQHLKSSAERTLDHIKVEEVFNKGHLKLESSRYTSTFGTNDCYSDELKFIKNKTGTYTAELMKEGKVISQSTRASSNLLSKIVCQMLNVTIFEF